jgi:ribA/ribD-fused uncharacterized protein
MNLPLDLETLRQAAASGERFRYFAFYGHTASAGVVTPACLSQWFPCEFVVDGVTYRSAEQWMMAGKARLFGDDEALAKILATDSPARAKRLGRAVRRLDAATWATHRVPLVAQGNVEKFGQNPALCAFLLGTGDAVLVEAAPRDTIWGIGLGRTNPLVKQPGKWRGLNLLGFALMRARESLRHSNCMVVSTNAPG